MVAVRSVPAGGWIRLVGAVGCGLGLAGLFWAAFSGPFPLTEFCSRNRPTWVIPVFERARYTSVPGQTFLLVMAAAGLVYLAALRLAVGLRGGGAALALLAIVPLALVAVLFPGYPLLSSDIFKYIFDGRITAVYGENPFLHVPAEHPEDRFYDLVYWKAVVNAHGPLWRVAEAGSAVVGGESCRNAVLAMKIWPVAAYLATTGVLFGLLRVWQPERAIVGGMLYAWNPLVALEALQNGHNDVVAALPALIAVWLALRDRVRWAFPVLALAALVKPLALALGPLLLVVALRRSVRPIREAAVGIGLGAALVALAYLPFWAGPTIFQGLARGAIFSTSPAQGLLELLEFLGVPLDRAMPVASGTANALFLLLLVPLLRAAWLGRLGPVAAAVGVFFVYLLVGAQWFNPWYLLWLVPFAALVPNGPPRALGLAFALLAPIVYAVPQTTPVVVVVFLPIAALAVYRRAWLGWTSASPAAGGPSADPAPSPSGEAGPTLVLSRADGRAPAPGRYRGP
jgi:alpha-1,6-mannosyltransferase